MFRIDNNTAVGVKPVPQAAGVPGFFTRGDPVGGIPATVVTADWANSIQEELISVLAAANVVPDKATPNQVLAALNSLFGYGKLLNVQVFTANGTYTPTPGTKSVVVEVQGGGGAGGGGAASTSTAGAVAPGGNAGAFGKGRITAGFAGAIVAVGAGGAGAVGANGGNGGASSFGAFISAPGGPGGGVVSAVAPPSLQPTLLQTSVATGGNIFNTAGATGGAGQSPSVLSGMGGIGGASVFGSGGAPVGMSTGAAANGRDGVAHGSAGSGGAAINAAATKGGNGAGGVVIVWEFA